MYWSTALLSALTCLKKNFFFFFFFWLIVWRYFNFATQHDDSWIGVFLRQIQRVYGPGHAAWYNLWTGPTVSIIYFPSSWLPYTNFFFFLWEIAIHSNWNTTRSNIHIHSSHKILDISDFKYLFYFWSKTNTYSIGGGYCDGELYIKIKIIIVWSGAINPSS